MSRSFAHIRESNQFFDCTLTTDDDEAYLDNLRAHKVILSASSEFFKKILTKETVYTNPDPVIYLRGISAKDLKHILDFIYQGEVNVAKEELNRFLEVAETLKIQALTSSVRKSKRPPKSPYPEQSNPIKKPKVVAWTPSQCMTKREPEDPYVAESLSFRDFENIDGENNDKARGQAYIEHSVSKHKEVYDGDDVDRGSEDWEAKVSKNNDCAVTEEDYEEKLICTNDDDVINAGDDNHSSGSTGGADNGEGNEPRDNKYPTSGSVGGGEGGDSIEDKEPDRPKMFKWLTGAEKLTLINIIKTLDKECLLINARNAMSLDNDTNSKRKDLWRQIVPAFNEICGTNYDLRKLRRFLFRIKSTPNSKYGALLHEDAAE